MIFILLILAFAAFKALADTTKDYIQYKQSIFFKPERSIEFWANDYEKPHYIPLTKYPWTMWHLANTGMIFSALGLPYCKADFLFAINPIISFGLLGICFIFVFNLILKTFKR